MSYKTILVHLDASERTRERIDIAATMAINSNAHLIGTAATGISGLSYLPGATGGSTTYLMGLLDSIRERANYALTEFESIVQKMEVMSFEKCLASEEAGVGVSLQARYSDLVIIGQTDPSEPSPAVRTDFPEYVVLHAGRPVLIIPNAGHFDHIGTKVLIAWDGSMEAARAVTGAIPLLKRAHAVQIVIFNPAAQPEAHGEQPGAELARYLDRYDIHVEVSHQTTTLEVGHALQSHAADFGADLIVMGGYGHSRFRELLLGGVTHTALKFMTVPTLIAH